MSRLCFCQTLLRILQFFANILAYAKVSLVLMKLGTYVMSTIQFNTHPRMAGTLHSPKGVIKKKKMILWLTLTIVPFETQFSQYKKYKIQKYTSIFF